MSTQDPFIYSTSSNASGSINLNTKSSVDVIVNALMWLLIVAVISVAAYHIAK